MKDLTKDQILTFLKNNRKLLETRYQVKKIGLFGSYVKNQGINLQIKFQEFLTDLKDNGYPAIKTQEAKNRVNKAVTDYRKNGTKIGRSRKLKWRGGRDSNSRPPA